MKKRAMIATGTFVSALVLAGCQQEANAPEPVRPVMSMVLEPSRTGGAVAVGVVEPQYKTNLAFRVLGRLTARPVSIGDLVSEGQTVGVIDSTALELAVRSAKAELAKAEALRATATGTEERQRTLITTDATTKQTLDNAEQARAGADASVARAQANLIKAVEQRGYAQVKSDFAGVVTAVGAEVGQVVSPGQNVVTVARPDIREAVVDIGEDFPVTHPNLVRFSGYVGRSGAVHASVTVHDKYASGSGRLTRDSGGGIWSGHAAGGRCSGYWTAQRNN
jgi:membrane fusion protein, multidrug efflux system